MTRVVAIVDDLMDRSRVAAAAPGAVATRTAADAADADIVVVDLARHADDVASVRRHAPGAFMVAFGRHDDVATLEAARGAGADRVLSRARFFADVAGALDPDTDPGTDAGSQPSDR